MRRKISTTLAAVLLLFAAYLQWHGGGTALFTPPGPRTVVVLRETADDGWKFNAMKTDLRNSEAMEKHDLRFYDDDAEIGELSNAFGGVELPAIAILASGNVLHVGPMPESAESVIALVQKWGG